MKRELSNLVPIRACSLLAETAYTSVNIIFFLIETGHAIHYLYSAGPLRLMIAAMRALRLSSGALQ